MTTEVKSVPSTGDDIRINTHYAQGETFDLCTINGSKFAVFHKTFFVQKDCKIDLRDYNIILLNQIEAQKITVLGTTILVMGSLKSTVGDIDVNASGKFLNLGGTIRSANDNNINAELDIFNHSVIKDRYEEILKLFQNAISEQMGPDIVEALMLAHSAAIDPSWENDELSLSDTLNFFGVPFTRV